MYRRFSLLLSPFLVLIFVAPCSLTVAQEAEVQDEVRVLTGATLIDGTGAAPQENVTLVIRGPLIEHIATEPLTDLPEGAEVVDLQGRFVVPGLIDAHTHLATNPSRDGYRAHTESTLRRMLGHGITDVRDMAGDGRVLAYLARQTYLGELPGPDIHFAAFLAGPGYFRDPRVQAASQGVELGQAAWAHHVTDETDLEALMEQIKGIGARGIKVYADISPALLEAITATAHTHGLNVWSHWVVQPRRTHALDAIQAGVDVVSHAFMLMFDAAPDERVSSERVIVAAGGETLFAAMREHGTILDATLIAATALPSRPGWVTAAQASADIVRAAHAAGIPIATGSDHPGNAEQLAIHMEYELLATEAGLSPLDVLESATRISARALGLGDARGTLEAGKEATLLILDGDPRESVAALAMPLFILKRGHLYSGSNVRDQEAPVEILSSFPDF